ncbi:hypothetical protein VM636_20570 [Streptomyces sp. SCSIO 75703]|uniref:SCO2583 family membrane protein n=1 Tax=unclassified Streptomyces TaxID=2593676 RepID=UPI0004C1B06D|nr:MULTISPECIES: hypothetical protein [unclassified Streptomyces]
MGGSDDPPEGTPEGAPGGGDDEYRSVVFDESFIRAARLQEYSAEERVTDHAPAVRRRPRRRRGLPHQALILVMLVAVAFGTAIYMGVRHPYQGPAAQRLGEPARLSVVPLAPRHPVPGADDPERLYAHSPAARFRTGADGITLPGGRRTAHFSDDQVLSALAIAKDYIVRSSLDPDVLTGGPVRTVRVLLDPDQHDQFDRGFSHPAADGRNTPTGWLVRFDPDHARLADDQTRVQGHLTLTESDSSTLEVTADHTLVYALRPADDPHGKVSLFTVRRELLFRFDRDDLRLHHTRLVTSSVRAGPLSCAENPANHLRPLLAGQTPKDGAPADTDPYTPDGVTHLCGTLADRAQPTGG